MTNLTCRSIGGASGLAIVVAAFLPWRAPIQRIHELWGLTVYSTDALFHFDFMTILAGVLYLLFLALAHKGRVWKTLGAIAAGACLLDVAGSYLFSRQEFVVGGTYEGVSGANLLLGSKLTLIASVLAIVMILLVKRDGASTPA
jgi:hypothetical protein